MNTHNPILNSEDTRPLGEIKPRMSVSPTVKLSDILRPVWEKQRRPGILDKLSLCETSAEALRLWNSFLDSGARPSRKTCNRAHRILDNLDPL